MLNTVKSRLFISGKTFIKINFSAFFICLFLFAGFGANISIAQGIHKSQNDSIVSSNKCKEELIKFEKVAKQYRDSNPKPDPEHEMYEPYNQGLKLCNQGYDCLSNKSYEKAIEYFRKAIIFFQKAIEIDPTYPSARVIIAHTLGHIKDYDNAICEMKKYLMLVPDDKDAQNQIQEWEKKILRNKINFTEELTKFEEVAKQYRELNPKPEISEEVRKLYVQATTFSKDKKYQEAIGFYEKIFELDVTFPDAHFNVALLLAQVEDYEYAIFEMKKYLMLVPDASDARAAQDKIYEWEAKNKK